ncbi:hypothetical protein [Niabella aurantiaca]|uniref:hypothetical protein n=1 Tax=Niabella aurantiaca TaxID=379900 RepID=UPI0012FC1691|nr:hypothetical protein [Niabella aurantiaca]
MISFEGEEKMLKAVALSSKPAHSREEGSYVRLAADGCRLMTGTSGSHPLLIVAADFNDDGREELATVSINEEEHLVMAFFSVLPAEAPDKERDLSPLGTWKIADRTSGPAWCGRIDHGGHPHILIAFPGPQNRLCCCICGKETLQKEEAPVLYPGPVMASGKKYDLVTGVFTGSKNDEMALFYEGEKDPDGNNLFLELLQVTQDGWCSVAKAVVGRTEGGVAPEGMQLVSGSFLPGSTTDGLVLTWTTKGQTRAEVQTWQYDAATGGSDPEALLKKESTTSLPVTKGLIRLAAGDLNEDGVEELVIGTADDAEGIYGHLLLQVFRFSNILVPELASDARVNGEEGMTFIAFDFKMAIANLEHDTGPAIIVAALGADNALLLKRGYARVSVGALQVDPYLKFPVQFGKPAPLPGLYAGGYAFREDRDLSRLRLELATGDFDGSLIKVGAPEMSVISDVQSVVAIVNIPPLPAEFQNEEENRSCSRQVSFTNTRGKTTSLSLNTHNSYTTSDNLTAELGASLLGSLTRSINNTYGEDFSKTQDKGEMISTSLNVSSNKEDIILLYVNVFNVWEYPVIHKNQEKGHLLVIFPQSGTGQVKTISGSDLGAMYKPRHTTGNILSYYSGEGSMTDYDPDLGNICKQEISVDNQDASIDVHFSGNRSDADLKTITQTTSINNSQSGNFSVDFLEGLSMGLSHSWEGSYTNSRSSNYTLGFNEETSIHLSVSAAGLDETMHYSIRPYVYWSKKGKYLKVDYIVNIPRGSTWFYEQFQRPNPVFHLPFTSKQYRLFTRDIEIVLNKKDPGLVDVTVRVHNNSFSATGPVTVGLFEADPLKDSPPVAPDQHIANIPVRGMEQLFFRGVKLKDLAVPGDGKCNVVYAVINPGETLAGTEPKDRIGFGYYPASFLGTSG